MALIKCPECGKEISDQAQSCPNCGYPINNAQQPPVADSQTSDTATTASPPPKKKGALKIALAIGVLVVIAAVAAFAFWSSGNKAKDALREDLNGVWYGFEFGADQALNFTDDRLTYDASERVTNEDRYALASEAFDWEPVSGDTISVNGDEYRVTSEENRGVMNLYPALTHDAEFESFARTNSQDEKIYEVTERSIQDSKLTGEIVESNYNITNNSEKTFKRIMICFKLQNSETEDVIYKKYIAVTPEDGTLDPGETETFYLSVPYTEVQNISQVDYCAAVTVGQER